MRRPSSLVTGVAAGLLAGAAATAAVAAFGLADREEDASRPAVRRGAVAAGELVVAWRASRLATWVIDGVYERRTAAGRRLTSEIHVAQRPPDRLSVGLGAVQARHGDRRLACATDPRNTLRCRDDGRAPPYEAEVADEVHTLTGYVSGPTPLYDVTDEGDGCFTLDLVVELPAPPYGRRARFCFDPVTKAPLLAEIRRPEAVDVRRSLSVRATVTDEDLAPPPGEPG